ncbi:MAG: hypothetical protein MRY74_05855 [Neomegalonema sp.]|nr:hypothetical protein [Neomegalonema sp.]
MKMFAARPSKAADISGKRDLPASLSCELTEQSPHPAILAALQTGPRKLQLRRTKSLTQRLRPKTDVSIDQIAGVARLFDGVDEAATAVQRTLPQMRTKLSDAHEYGADPMLWTRASEPQPAQAQKAAPRSTAPRGGWLMNLFF